MENPSKSPTETLRVALGERSYDILFFHDAPGSVAGALAPFCREGALVVTNDTIWGLHGASFAGALEQAGIRFKICTIPDGERFKTLDTASTVFDRLIDGGFSRGACVVAFGGGVVGDLAGFVAATFMRGVSFVQVPTTVVSMVDSAVGGKTGVDHARGKNLIGAFWQPRLVAMDLAYLGTLDDHNRRGGFAEVIKYGVIRDPELFAFLEGNIAAALALDPDALRRAVHRSCEIKAEVVGADERESGLRAILNFGHTFGHAIENLGEYRELQFHGQAVAIGMVAAGETARLMGIFPEADLRRLRSLVKAAGLPHTLPPGMDPGEIIARMATDKKAAAGKLRFVLPTRIGDVVIRDDVPTGVLLDALGRLRTQA